MEPQGGGSPQTARPGEARRAAGLMAVALLGPQCGRRKGLTKMSRRSGYQYPRFNRILLEKFTESGLSVAEFAARARIHKSYAYRILYELYWPSVPVLWRIEKALGLEPGDLSRLSQLCDKS